MKNTQLTISSLFSLLATFAICPASVTFFDNEAAFTTDLVDPVNFGSVGVDVHGADDITNLSSITTEVSINGSNYAFTFSEHAFDTTFGGTASQATAASTIAELIIVNSNFSYEAGSTDQSGASSPSWGFDSGGTPQSGNAVGLFDFTASPTDVLSFSLDLIDFEAGNALDGVVAAYRADGSLIDQFLLGLDAPHGNSEVNYLGLGADEAISYLAFFVGEDSATGTGVSESFALADFQLGSSLLNSVPEPSSFVFLGCSSLIILLRRTR